MEWLEALPENRRRGSYPLCLLRMHGARTAVAERLTNLVALPGVRVAEKDLWMPKGLPRRLPNDKWNLGPTKEAKLGETQGLLTPDQQLQVTDWWLAVRKGPNTNTPNWDIASTCVIHGRRGLLLIEAKAHATELEAESRGKELRTDASDNSKANHDRIGAAISHANDALGLATGLTWGISRDSHYQMSNRFAWAWKVAELGIPVVLVYLGFLAANEVSDLGTPFPSHDEWEHCVRGHSSSLVPPAVWGQTCKVGAASLTPLIRSVHQPFTVVPGGTL